MVAESINLPKSKSGMKHFTEIVKASDRRLQMAFFGLPFVGLGLPVYF